MACTRLYKSLCRLVGWSIGPSVSPSVRPSALTKMSQISTIRLFQRWRRSVMIRRAPVEVYTALLLPLPKSTRLMTPCIRPCLSIIEQRGVWWSDKLLLKVLIYFIKFSMIKRVFWSKNLHSKPFFFAIYGLFQVKCRVLGTYGPHF